MGVAFCSAALVVYTNQQADEARAALAKTLGEGMKPGEALNYFSINGRSMPSHISLVAPLRPAWPSCAGD